MLGYLLRWLSLLRCAVCADACCCARALRCLPDAVRWGCARALMRACLLWFFFINQPFARGFACFAGTVNDSQLLSTPIGVGFSPIDVR